MNDFNIYDTKFKNVHLIGIGGVSMSGLATILLKKGYTVSGSDMNDSLAVENLRANGAKINIGHSENNIENPDLVIYTDAINSENPEYLKAKKQNIACIDRGTFLGQLMKLYKQSIAVSGTHGKTTTTGMLSVLLRESSLDPTILLGGYLKQIKGNIQIGGNDLLITEACEYKGNILKFHSTVGTVLNIEADHLDYYKDLQEIVDTFKGFVKLIPEDGYLVVNANDPSCTSLLEAATCRVITFGEKEDSTYRISDIKLNPNATSSYKLTVGSDKSYDVHLSVLGTHNIYNSVAAIASAHMCGVDIEYLIAKIKEYTGTERRLQLKGSFSGINIIDDYAHHPTEIKATLSAVKNLNASRVWCIFQPHTYTRTLSLLEDFSNSFYDADKVIITDIYAAREKDNGSVSSKDLADKLKANGVDVLYISNFDEIEKHIKENARENDIVITMGAGDVYRIGENILGIY